MGSSLYLSGGVQSTSKLTKTFSVANSFAVGDVVRYDIPSSSYVKAQADTATNAEVVGVVEEATAGQFTVVYSGEIDLTSVSALSGFNGPVLFLSNSVAGGLTANPPSAIGAVVKPLVVRNAATNQYVVTNFLGTQIGGSSTVAIDEIQPVGTIMPFAGSVIPESWLECNGNSYAVSAYPQLYAKLQNSSGDRVPAHGYVVQIGVNTTTYATWFSSVAVGDTILYSPTQADLTVSPAVTTYALIGRVIAKGTASVTVQIFEKYVQDTGVKNSRFEYPNVIPSTVGWVAAFLPVANTTIYDNLNSTQRRGNAAGQPAAAVSTVAVTHFNTPDLRGRFAIGTNTADIADAEGDGNNYSAIAGLYPLGSQGGQEVTPAGTGVAGPGTFAYVTPGTNGLVANMPPYTAVQYIIKASPYTRAAIIDGLDLPYNNLLVGDLRDGALRPGGAGEDLLFKTNNGSGGTERMRLTNDGKLGLGTSNPPHRLCVTDGGSLEIIPATTYVISQSYNRSNSNYIEHNSRGSIVTLSTPPTPSSSSVTERLRVDANGNVGIGTTAPGYTLDITANGTARIGSALVTSTTITLGSANVIMNGSGGLAVGTSTAPSAKAEIHGADGTKQGLFVNLGGTDAASTATSLATMWTRAPVHIKMTGTSTNRLLLGGLNTGEAGIQSSSANGGGAFNLIMQPYGGLVGIGYPAPAYKLDVYDGSTTTSAMRLTTGGNRSYIHFKDSGTGTQSQIGCAGNDLVMVTGGTERMRITSGGVGVSSVWIPSVANFSFAREADATQGNAALSTAITVPGSASETYSIIVFFTSYSYSQGDSMFMRSYGGIPGGASIRFSNDEGALYSINGTVQSGTFNGTRGWRRGGTVMYFRTA